MHDTNRIYKFSPDQRLYTYRKRDDGARETLFLGSKPTHFYLLSIRGKEKLYPRKQMQGREAKP